MKETINLQITREQYRFLVDSLNMAADIAATEGMELTEPALGILKKVLIAGLKAGWSKLPPCFNGDKEFIAAAEESLRRFGEEPDPFTKH